MGTAQRYTPHYHMPMSCVGARKPTYEGIIAWQSRLSFVELSCGVFEGLNGVLFGTEYQRKEPYRRVIWAIHEMIGRKEGVWEDPKHHTKGHYLKILLFVGMPVDNFT